MRRDGGRPNVDMYFSTLKQPNAFIPLVMSLTALSLVLGHAALFGAGREEARSGVYSYENRHLVKLDAEREKLFRARKRAWEFFAGQAPSYRQTAIYWVMNAKREETRSNRLAKLIEVSASSRRML